MEIDYCDLFGNWKLKIGNLPLFYLQNFINNLLARQTNSHFIANPPSHECCADRGVVRNDSSDRIGFGGAEDFVGSLFVVVCDGDAAA